MILAQQKETLASCRRAALAVQKEVRTLTLTLTLTRYGAGRYAHSGSR